MRSLRNIFFVHAEKETIRKNCIGLRNHQENERNTVYVYRLAIKIIPIISVSLPSREL